MDRGLLIKQLQAAPVAIRSAEEARDTKFFILVEAQRLLADAEQNYLLNDHISGKNEAMRAAQLAVLTAAERVRVFELENQLRALNREVRFQERMFEALLKVADLYVEDVCLVKET